MQIFLCKDWGEISLAELSPPSLQTGEVLIKVRAVNLAHQDWLMLNGNFQAKPPFPFVPGGSFAGEVVESQAKGFRKGTQVLGWRNHGALAEYIAQPASQLLVLPEALNFAEGCNFILPYSLAYIALAERVKLAPDTHLLVTGASGRLGQAALDWGKALGAKVIALSKQASSSDFPKADAVLAQQSEHLFESIQNITRSKGLQVIYDVVGGKQFVKLLQSLSFEGQAIIAGYASGNIPQVSTNNLVFRCSSISAVYWSFYLQHKPDLVQEAVQASLQKIVEKELSPKMPEVFLSRDYREAFQSWKEGEYSSIILTY